MAANYHHPEAQQMTGRSLGLAPAVDRLSVLTLASARSIGWHSHADTEVICCIKGHLEYEFEGHAKVSIHSGCYLVVPNSRPHRLSGGVDGPCRRLSFYLKPATRNFSGLVPFTRSEYRTLLGDILKKRFKPKAFRPSADLPRIADLADRGKLSSREKVELRILVVHALLSFAETTAPTHAVTSTKIMDEAVRWLETHAAEKVTIDQLTAFMGYGKSQLFALFKNLTGLSPIEWLNHHRVDKAAALLESSKKPIHEIALSVGFESPAFFAKIFYRYKGVSPSHYRYRIAASKV